MSFANLKLNDLDLDIVNTLSNVDMDFIDTACTDKSGFFLPTSNASKSNSSKSKNMATEIASLRNELNKAKYREKALLKEFAHKFKALQQQDAPKFNIITESQKTSMPFDEEEMPMDEMAATARMERVVRTMENAEQQRMIEELKRQQDEQMYHLQQENEKVISSFEKKLMEKMQEMEEMQNYLEAVENERNLLAEKVKTPCVSPDTVANSSSNATQNNSFGQWNNGVCELDSSLEKTVQLSPQKSSITPLQRLRYEKQKQNLKNQVATPPTVDTCNTSDGSLVSDSANASKQSNVPPSRLSALFESVTDPKLNSIHNLLTAVERKIQECAEEDDSGHDEMLHLDKQSKTFEYVDKLSDAEKEFVDRVASLFKSTLSEQMELIQHLQTELVQTHDDFQSNEADMSKMLEETYSKIEDLEMELDSLKNTKSHTEKLQGFLNMIADDKNSSSFDLKDLEQKLQGIEDERNSLMEENLKVQKENEETVLALRKVIDDMTKEKEEVVKELMTRLQHSEKECDALKEVNGIDNDLKVGDDNAVLIDINELNALRRQTESSSSDKEITTLTQELNEAKLTISKLEKEKSLGPDEMLDLQLQEIREANADLQSKLLEQEREFEQEKKKLEHSISNLDQDLATLHEESENNLRQLASAKNMSSALEKENEKLKEKTDTLTSELENAQKFLQVTKEAHSREQSLENDLEKSLQEIEKLREDTESEKQVLIDQCEDLESKVQELQLEIIEMKEEKLSLKIRVRDAETAFERCDRIMTMLQETNVSQGTSSQALAEFKDQLHEIHDHMSKLRNSCDEDCHEIIDVVDKKVHMILCLLETNVIGINGSSTIVPFDFSNGVSPKEVLLERSLRMMRSETDRIKKNIEELKTEKDQETAILGIELASLQGKFEAKCELLEQKEEELKNLKSSFTEQSMEYISDDDSDGDIEENSSLFLPSTSLHPNAEKEFSDLCKQLQSERDEAQKNSKKKDDDLAEAKMIISSLEQSNKAITDNLRSRLHDSNAALVSLLEQSKQKESENAELKSKLQAIMEKVNDTNDGKE
ncbi:predicted protein [Chaetoceros tenuissimus]|uniref:Uncharacterized protein n=1 Tax=Chaetoceros tenuissimus TaxID=426638 RepID=A0AAD3CUQ1_9STRA|nr:predicted protein [Chaetoceros tenuissimus]